MVLVVCQPPALSRYNDQYCITTIRGLYFISSFEVWTLYYRSFNKPHILFLNQKKMPYKRCSDDDKDPDLDLEQGDIEIEVERESDSEFEFNTPIYTPPSSTSLSPALDQQEQQQQQQQQNEPRVQPNSQSEPQPHSQSQSESQSQPAVYQIHYYPNKVLECGFWDLAGFVLAFVLLVILGVVWVEAVRNAD